MDCIFKTKLREELNFQDMRVKELAALTGISQRTLESYLSARETIPPADVAVKIASVLHVSVEYLVTGQRKASDKTEGRSGLERQLHNSIEKLSADKQRMVGDMLEVMQKYEVTAL